MPSLGKEPMLVNQGESLEPKPTIECGGIEGLKETEQAKDNNLDEEDDSGNGGNSDDTGAASSSTRAALHTELTSWHTRVVHLIMHNVSVAQDEQRQERQDQRAQRQQQQGDLTQDHDDDDDAVVTLEHIGVDLDCDPWIIASFVQAVKAQLGYPAPTWTSSDDPPQLDKIGASAAEAAANLLKAILEWSGGMTVVGSNEEAAGYGDDRAECRLEARRLWDWLSPKVNGGGGGGGGGGTT